MSFVFGALLALASVLCHSRTMNERQFRKQQDCLTAILMSVQNGKFFGQPLEECLEEIEKIAQDAMSADSEPDETKDLCEVNGEKVKVIVGKPIFQNFIDEYKLAQTEAEREFFGEA